MAKKSSLSIQFDSHDVMNHFWRWLCESGEQQYWDYMSYREEDEDGDITVLKFEYEKADKGLITTMSGRFTGQAAVTESSEDE